MSSHSSNSRIVASVSPRSPLLLIPGLLCTLCGCTSDQSDKPRSVLDSIAEVEKFERGEAGQGGSTKSGGGISPVTEGAKNKSGTFTVQFETTAGDFVVLVHRDWSPVGAERFYKLVTSGFYDECRFFRVLPDFMVQFGINGDPAVQQQWDLNLKDDPVRQSNKKGYMTFATAGPDTRTTQVFINYKNNQFLDNQGFAPFGEVIEGMENVEGIYSGHGEKPDQSLITERGNEYLKARYPELDYIKKAQVVEETTE